MNPSGGLNPGGMSLPQGVQQQQALQMMLEQQDEQRRAAAIGAALELAKLSPGVAAATALVREAHIIEDYLKTGVRRPASKS
jgi:hypothetical protein